MNHPDDLCQVLGYVFDEPSNCYLLTTCCRVIVLDRMKLRELAGAEHNRRLRTLAAITEQRST